MIDRRIFKTTQVKNALVMLYHRAEALPIVGPLFPRLRNIYRRRTGRGRIISVGPATTSAVQYETILADVDEFNDLKASNSISASKIVMEKALSSMGLPSQGHAVVEKLRVLESRASAGIDWVSAETHEDPIVRFQAAIRYDRSGNKEKSIALYESIAHDKYLERRLHFSPEYTSAYIRSVEVYGHFLEEVGREAEALDLYKKIIRNGCVAPHLSFKGSTLAGKLGRKEEASELAVGLKSSDNNFSHGRAANPALDRLLNSNVDNK